MKCPQCGYEIGTSHRCIRCGCEISSVATVDDSKQKKTENEKQKSEEPSVKVIDPSQVYITDSPSDYEDSYDPIASLFDGFFGDPISDLLSMFGFGSSRSSHFRTTSQPREPEPKRRKQGKIVELDDVEILDENNNTIYKKSKKNNNDKK